MMYDVTISMDILNLYYKPSSDVEINDSNVHKLIKSIEDNIFVVGSTDIPYRASYQGCTTHGLNGGGVTCEGAFSPPSQPRYEAVA